MSEAVEKFPAFVKDQIEAVRCRRCGATKGGACFTPQNHAVMAAVAFVGTDYRTEFCYERVHDYFEQYRPQPQVSEPDEPNARIYPCLKCGLLRSKAEGGTVFTVCDKCWGTRGVQKVTS